MKTLFILCYFILLFDSIVGLSRFLGKYSSLTDQEILGTQIPHITNKIAQNSDIKFSGFPTTLEDGEDVVISWSNIPQPNIYDFISISCGPTNGLEDYLDKQNVSKNAAKIGSGSVRFRNLVMMRCNYDFMYISCQSPLVCSALAKTTVTMRNGLNFPHHGHISFTENADEMAVSYVSASNDSASVRYGTDPNNLNMIVYASKSVTYKASDMCNSPANITAQQWFRDPGYIHHIILTHLKYSTTYYYQYGNDKYGWSPVYSFISRPSPEGVSAYPVTKFLAYGDFGDWEPQSYLTALHSTIEVQQNGFNNFLLHFGDISYARGAAWNWDTWFHMLEPYATQVPYLVSIGNHEYDHIAGGEHDPSGAPGIGWHPRWGNMGDDSNGECAVPPFYRFVTPQNGHSIFWYSFDYGAVHVIQISSEHDWTRDSVQYKWLEKDLASVNRTKTPWVILTSHRMMYTTQLAEDDDYVVSEHFKAELDDLINTYGVNLMLVGHQHSYERSCPVYFRRCVESGEATVHIIVGTAGAGVEQGGFSDKLGNWSLVHTEQYGYCRLTADVDSLFVEFIENFSGDVFDQVVLQPWFGKKYQK